MNIQRAAYDVSSRLSQRMRLMPHVSLGTFSVLPKLDGDGYPIPDSWVLPGRRVVNTDELYALASRNNWPIIIHCKGVSP